MLGQLWTMAVFDLRQRVRDKSVVIFGVVVPLALISVLNLVFGDMGSTTLKPVTVATSVPADDPLAQTIPDVLGSADLGDLTVTLEPVDADQVRRTVEDQEAELGLLVPEGFGAAVQSGRPVEVTAIRGEGNDLEIQVVLSVVDGVLQQFAAAAEAGAAGAVAGLPPEDLAEVAQASVTDKPRYDLVEGRTSAEQLDVAGALVAGQAGLFLLFTVGFGVLALVTERETGTLGRLRTMPMRTGLVVVAKAFVSVLLGVVSTSILLTAGGALFGVDFGSPGAVAVLVVTAAASATTLMFVIARLARTSEQTGVAQSIVAMLLGIAGGAFFPVTAPGFLGTLLDLNPVAAFTRGLGITAGGGGVADLATPLAILVGFGVAMLALSRVVPDRGATS